MTNVAYADFKSMILSMPLNKPRHRLIMMHIFYAGSLDGQEERTHPDSPGGLEVVAAQNKPFAERLIDVFRLAKSRVKKDERR